MPPSIPRPVPKWDKRKPEMTRQSRLTNAEIAILLDASDALFRNTRLAVALVQIVEKVENTG